MSELIDGIDPLFLKYLLERGILRTEYLNADISIKSSLNHDYEESKKAQSK